MDAINTLILKLIICSACTCTTGEGISAHLLGFTHFSISRWGRFFWFLGCNFNKFKGFSGFLSGQVQTSDYCIYLKNVFKCQLFSRTSKRKRMLLVLWREKNRLFSELYFLWVRLWSEISQKMTLCIGRKGNYLPCSKNKTEKNHPGELFLDVLLHVYSFSQSFLLEYWRRNWEGVNCGSMSFVSMYITNQICPMQLAIPI